MNNTNNKQDFSWLSDFRREQLKKSSRNPGLAALMSFFLMGLGQIYAGHVDRGIILVIIHLFSLFTGYSIYSGGFFYNWIIASLGANLLIVVIYLFTVVFILIWIFNIKDAYYLAVFSGFRDWFEIERVLLPSLGVPEKLLLSNTNNLLLENNNESDIVEIQDDNSIDKNNSDKIKKDVEVIGETSVHTKPVFVNSINEEADDSDTKNLIYMNTKSFGLITVYFLFIILGIGLYYYFSSYNSDSALQVSRDLVVNNAKTNESTKQNEVKIDEVSVKESNNVKIEASNNLSLKEDNKVSLELSKQQIESYVDKRILDLLTLKNNFSNRDYFSHNNNNESSVPVFVSADVKDDKVNSSEETHNYESDDDYSSAPKDQVVIIQGHKETKYLKKTAISEEKSIKDGYERGKVLYEAPSSDNKTDEVELIMGDEININSFGNSEFIDSSEPISVVTPVVPNVNQNLIDSIKKEKLEEINEKALKSINQDIFNKKFDSLEPRLSRRQEKKSDLQVDSLENKIALEKIKERGAYEFYHGNWEAALPYYFEVLKYRRNAESFEMVGIIFEKMDKLSDAFEAFENAYKLGLDSKHNLARLGLIAEKLGNYESAQKYLEKAIEKNPKRADIILSYARCLDRQGENLAAIQVLAVLRDNTDSYAIKKAADQEYLRIYNKNSKKIQE